MHRDVFQIIKHNGDNDAFVEPRFLPDTTAVSSTRPTNPPSVFLTPASSEMNPVSPSLRFEEEHVPNRWGELFHFPERFATRKIFLFPKDLGMSQPPQCQRLITCHDAGLPVWKGFKVRGLEVPKPPSPWPESKQSNYSFMPGCQGWCADDIFPQLLCCRRSKAERIVRV